MIETRKQGQGNKKQANHRRGNGPDDKRGASVAGEQTTPRVGASHAGDWGAGHAGGSGWKRSGD